VSTTNKGLYDLIGQIYHRKYHSVWTNTKGRNQSGKTDWNLRQFEMLNDLGLAEGFGTNMESVKSKDFDIELIRDFQTLKARCKMLNPRPDKQGIKRFFFLISELADFVPQDQPWSNVDFIKELQKVRKYGLSLLSDSISRVDGRVLNENHFHGYFVKYNKGNPRVAKYYNWINNRVFSIRDIPRTTIKFDTYESASFYMETQTEDTDIPLNPDHQILKQYLEAGSIKASGLHPQAVKRARDRVLDYHMRHCVYAIHEKEPVKEEIEPTSKDKS